MEESLCVSSEDMLGIVESKDEEWNTCSLVLEPAKSRMGNFQKSLPRIGR